MQSRSYREALVQSKVPAQPREHNRSGVTNMVCTVLLQREEVGGMFCVSMSKNGVQTTLHGMQDQLKALQEQVGLLIRCI